MRMKLGWKYGKKVYTKKDFKVETPHLLEHLYIPLYNSEKYWAFAMELKQVPSNVKHGNKIRYNIRKKLKKAVQWSKEFSSMCERVDVKRTSLEGESQKSFLEGLVAIEFKNYENALEHLLKSKKIMLDLVEVAGVIEKAHLQEKIEQIEHNIRFCKYNLRKFDSNMQNELVEMQN